MNESIPLVSVLMTSFNREKFIGAAIESVLASTYKNFELIICDDASKDKTVEIAKLYADQDKRIRLYINEKNLGQFPNRNYAASLASGKYIKYVDSDDLIYPSGLEILVTMMEKYPEAGYGLCSLEQDRERVYPFMLTPKEAYERHFIKNIPLFHKAPLSSIIKKETFKSVNGFSNSFGEGDYDLWLNLSTLYNVVLMPEGVVWYREHDDQIDSARRNNRVIQFRYFLVSIKYLNDKCPLNGVDKDSLIINIRVQMIRFIFRAFITDFSLRETRKMYLMARFTIFQIVSSLFIFMNKKIVKYSKKRK
jgi:glycosyltransferase involved in cell wall biosynthesis